jgi:hypothetical protein
VTIAGSLPLEAAVGAGCEPEMEEPVRMRTSLATQVKRRGNKSARHLDARSRAAFAVWLKRRVEAGRGPTYAELSRWFVTDGPHGIAPSPDVLHMEYLRAVGLIEISRLAASFAFLEDRARRQLRELSSSIARVLRLSEMMKPEPDFEQVLIAAMALEKALQTYKPRLARELPTLDECADDVMRPDFDDRRREFVKSCTPMRDAMAVELHKLDIECAKRGARPKSDDAYAADERAIELAVAAGASKTEAAAVLGVGDKLKKRRRRLSSKSGKHRRHGGQLA